MNLILFGRQGAGKGTQAGLLAKEFKLIHVSPGDLFRQAIDRESPLGEKVKSYVNQGLLVPDEVTIDLVADFIKRKKGAQNGFIFDGFPRNEAQYHGLQKIMTDNNLDLTKVVYIDIGREESLKRLLGRRVCQACKKTYNIHFVPPAEAGVCDVCGGKLIKRKDENKEAIEKRLAIYEEETLPLLDNFDSSEVLIVDGVGPVTEIFNRIIQGL